MFENGFDYEAMSKEEHTCCICGKKYVGFGNNPSPYNSSGDGEYRCCDECNFNVVIPLRLYARFQARKNKPNNVA